MKTKVPKSVVVPLVSDAEIAKLLAPSGPFIPEDIKALYAKPPSAPLIDAVSMSAVTATQAAIQAANAPAQPVVTIAVIAVGQVIEWKKGKCAGALGHVVSVEPDGVICVQQPCDLQSLRWFKAPNGEFKIIGRAAGIYKIPAAEIQKHSERFKPKVKKPEQWDSPQ